MEFRDILFDLDGTLTDPAMGITNSVMYALKRYGIEVEDRSELYKFIGPPLAESFEKYYGFSTEESYRAVDVYREYYRDKGIFENVLYDGVEDMLAKLKAAGKRVFLATSKPEIFANRILEHFGILKYFDGVTGSELSGERTDKAEVIKVCRDRYSIADAVMVGDRSFDVIGAKENKIPSVAVLYGYGSREEFEESGPDYIVEKVSDLEKIILKIDK